MKIISKYKDYYDYLIGIYGVDPLITYDRRCEVIEYKSGPEFKIISRKPSHFIFTKEEYSCDGIEEFLICGKIYRIVLYKDKVYATLDELLKLQEQVKHVPYSRNSIYEQVKDALWHQYGTRTYWRDNERIITTKKNEILNCPIITYGNSYPDTLHLNPKLADYKLNKILPAHELYLIITQFLSKKDLDMPADPKDMFRYESKGFDKKTSFRH